MHITADTVCCTNFFHFLDGFDRVVKLLVVDSFQFPFFESQAELFATFFFNVLEVSCFRESLRGVEDFATTDRSTPQTYIIRVFQFGEVRAETMFVQIINFFLTAQCHVTGQCDDFYIGSQYEESHVETDLVIACSGRTVCDGICTDFVGIACDSQCLENTFGTNRNRISTVTQHISENHVFQALFVVFLGYVQRHVFHCSQFISVFFVCFQLFFAETTRIGTSCIYFVTFFFGEVHDGERCVQPAAECHHYFFLLFFHSAVSFKCYFFLVLF